MDNYNSERFNVPPFVNVPPQYSNYTANFNKIDNGPIWFVTLAPVFSLFLEKISGNKIAALVLWIFAYILCVLVCLRDYKSLCESGVSCSGIKKYAAVPVIYLFMRNQTIGHQKAYPVICVICTIIAIMQNGFVSAALYTDDDYIDTVKSYSCTQLEDFKDNEKIKETTVAKALEQYFGHDQISWSYSKTGKSISEISADASISYNGKKTQIEIVFEMDYDGFDFKGIEISRVSLDGKELTDENRSALLMQIFSDNGAADATDEYGYVKA